MDLAAVASVQALEAYGLSFLEAVTRWVESTEPRDKTTLDGVRRTFNKDCQRMGARLKSVKICPRQKRAVLICLQRLCLPRDTGAIVMAFLL